MQLIKGICIAFSIYSQIPVPQFAWEEKDMKYMLCFFPWVGAVIGVLLYVWAWFCGKYGVENLCYTLIGAAVPLVVTGGFHVDGFMDTMDAFHSYQPKEKKLEILKDAHIGAFAVIMLATYGLVYLGAFSQIKEFSSVKIFGAGFFLSRCLSGIAVVSFPAAKKEGLLFLFSDSAHRNIVKGGLYLQGILAVAFMLSQGLMPGGITVVVALGIFLGYALRCKKELGGITGDTAGYFVVLCEGAMVVALALLEILV